MRQVLSPDELHVRLNSLNGWHYRNQALEKEFIFPDFRKAMGFLVQIGLLSEQADHHPELWNAYNKVRVRWNTHTVQDVTLLDVQMAEKTDALQIT